MDFCRMRELRKLFLLCYRNPIRNSNRITISYSQVRFKIGCFKDVVKKSQDTSGLIKRYNQNKQHPKDQYSNKEAVYFEVVNRKCLRYAEVQKNVNVSYTMLNNLQIHMNDPCKLKWKLPIEHLKLLNAETLKTDNKLQKL